MTSNNITVHYRLLPKHIPENESEPRRYSCSECDDDIFNVNLHAEIEHDTLLFVVYTNEEQPREEIAPPPFHPCGIYGCTFEPHDTGLHSWQRGPANA